MSSPIERSTTSVAADDDSFLLPRQRTVTAYNIYVLFILLVANLIKILDRYLLGVVTTPMSQELHYGEQRCLNNVTSDGTRFNCAAIVGNKTQCNTFTLNGTLGVCKWDYDGQGWQYELLAGPVFIIVYSIAAVPIGLLADFYDRRALLAASLALSSAMTVVSGFVNQYWQLVLTRFAIGVSQAGTVPFSTTLISDYFAENHRTLAISIFNSGAYFGAGLSYAFGNFVTDALSWRWAWITSGIPGLVVAPLAFVTIAEPGRKGRGCTDHLVRNTTDDERSDEGRASRMISMCSAFLLPSIILFCIAGCMRTAASYVWSYNTQLFYQELGLARKTIGTFMTVIPSVGGSLGCIAGGFISDRVRGDKVHAGLAVLVASQILSFPFIVGTILCPPPFSFVNLSVVYVLGEMWSGITLAVSVGLAPSELQATAVGVFMFISHIGGLVPILVPSLKAAFLAHGYSEVFSLRSTLLILCPGCYATGAILFMFTMVALRWERRHLAAGYRPIS